MMKNDEKQLRLTMNRLNMALVPCFNTFIDRSQTFRVLNYLDLNRFVNGLNSSGTVTVRVRFDEKKVRFGYGLMKNSSVRV